MNSSQSLAGQNPEIRVFKGLEENSMYFTHLVCLASLIFRSVKVHKHLLTTSMSKWAKCQVSKVREASALMWLRNKRYRANHATKETGISAGMMIDHTSLELSLLPGEINCWFGLHLYPYSFSFSRISYKWNQSVCSLLNLASFTKHNACGIHPYYFVYQ